MSRFAAVALAVLSALLLAAAAPAAAVTSTVDILLDLDFDASTGCTVSTPDGPFAGAEQILRVTIETSGAATADVTAVDRLECTDPGADTFGGPVAVAPPAPPWGVGVGLGLDGFHVVEALFPLSATTIDPDVIRIGVVHSRDQAVDTLLVATPGTDAPILLDLRSVLEIPTLGEWGLILLALLLAGSSLYVLGRRGVAALVLILALGTGGLAWAQCVLDGQPGEWAATDLLGADPSAADDGIAIRGVFGRAASGTLCLRVDLSLLFDEPPTITDVADQTIPEDGTTGALAFTVGDAEDAATALTVTAVSSNQVLVPDANLTLGGAGANRTITVTPAANQNGMTDVTLTVQDTAGGTASTTFRVTVTSENDAPTISAIADQSILEDGTTGPLAFTVGDTETAAGSLTVSTSSNDQTIIPDGNLALGGSGANRTITITPAADQFGGPVTVTVTVQDADGGSVPEQLTVTVSPVNDAPSFSLSGDVVSNEDAGAQMVAGQATAISAGPANEAGQTVTFQVTNDNNGLFSSQPAIDSAGTLTYTAAANASGSALVTVTAMDDGGTANGGVDTSASQTFTIIVNPVDDPATTGTDVYRTVGNTLLEVDDTRDDPLPSIFVAGTVLANDSDPDTALSVTGTTGVTAGAVVNMAADGTFTYVPPPGLHGDGNPATADDSFQYQLSGGELGTVEIDIDGLVWYVDNTAGGGAPNTGTGTSTDRFSTLSDAESASIAGDRIYVFQGDGTDTNYGAGFTMKDGQMLLGEGVDLVVDVNGTPTTLFTGATANKPLVQAASGTAVTFGNASGEVAGLDIRGDHGVSVTPGGGASVVVRDNALSGLGGSAGLFVDHNVMGAQDLAVLRNTIGGTVGADVTNTQGTLNLVFDGNTGLESTDGGAAAAGTFSAAGGSFFVTSFNANQVAGTTATSGLRFDGVVFDADPSDPDFTGDEVAAGDTAVGTAGDPVAGPALVLTDVSGDLAFGTLDLFTDGVDAPGLDVTGNGVFNAAAGTGFEITSTGGTIVSSNGPAVNLDPLTAGLTFDSVSSGVTTGGAHAIRLHDLAGSFTATGGSLVNTSGSAVAVTGTNPGDSSVVVSLSGMTIDHGAGTTPVILGQNSIGMFSLTGSTITKGGGRLVDFDDMDGGSDFTGTTITSTDHHGKRLVDSSGTHTFADVVIDGSTPAPVEGVFLQNNTGIVNFGRVDVHANAAPAFFASNGGTVNVADATSQLTARGHRALDASGTAFNNVTFAGATVPAASPSGTGGVALSNNTGTLTIGKVDVTTTGGVGFSATNAGTVNVTDATSRIDATNGPGLVINPTAVNLQFALVRSIGSGTTGIDIAGASGTGVTIASADIDDTTGPGVQLTNNTAPVAINGGTIGETVNTGTTTGGNALDVDGGAAAVTVAAAITNNAARSVEVTGRTGGTVTVGGAIADTGAGVLVSGNGPGSTVFSSSSKGINTGGNSAVTLTNNTGHLVDFTGGGLDIDTTAGAGFTATGGGTVQVRGTGNTVDTTTGTGVRIADTDIGASGVTWQSVSVNGAPNGIFLDTTGASGDFTVTGDGAMTAGILDRNGSGGTILGTTDDGVYLEAASRVTLRQMNIHDVGDTANSGDIAATTNDHAVESVGGGGIVLSAVHIRNPIGTGWEAFDITGVNRLDHGSLVEELDRTSNFNGLRVTNTGTSFTSFTVADSRFDHKDPTPLDAATNGNSMVVLSTRGAVNGTWMVDGNTFVGARGQAMTIGSGDAMGSTGTLTTVITDNLFETAHGTNGQNNLGIQAQEGTTHQVTITGNTFQDVGRGLSNSGQIIVQKDDTATLDASISGNTIHNVTAQRGIEVLALTTSSGGKVDAEIFDNVIYDVGREGIYVSARGNEPDMDVRIFNNIVGRTAPAGLGGTISPVGGQNDAAGVFVDAQANAVMDVQIDGNEVIADTASFGACGGSNCGVATINVENFPSGSAVVNATVENNIFNNNDASGTNFLARARDCGLTLNVDLGGNGGGGSGGGDGIANTATGTTTSYDILDDSFGCTPLPTLAVENLANVDNDNLPAGNVNTTGTSAFGGDVTQPDF